MNEAFFYDNKYQAESKKKRKKEKSMNEDSSYTLFTVDPLWIDKYVRNGWMGWWRMSKMILFRLIVAKGSLFYV